MRRIPGCSVLLIASTIVSLPVSAAVTWPTWTGPVGNVSTARFPGGQTVTLTGNFTDITAGVPAGVEFTASPSIPGRPDNTNPSFQRVMTGVPGTALPAGTVVAAVDLGGMAGLGGAILGFGDLKQGGVYYKLELRDASSTLLPLTGIVVTPYNVTYSNGLMADLNSLLETTSGPLLGRLSLDNNHDAGGTHTHTSLTTYSNLPIGTRFVTLLAWIDQQEVEGIQVYVGATGNPGVAITDSSGTADDKSVSLGTAVQAGTSNTSTVTLTNNSPSAVTVLRSSDLAAPFSFQNAAACNVTLTAGQSCTLTIVFAPTASGTFSDFFVLNVGGNTERIDVQGTAVAASGGSGGGAGGGSGSGSGGGTTSSGKGSIDTILLCLGGLMLGFVSWRRLGRR
jgi:hypothetical protein